jgi:predicted dehydrogenase
VISVGFLGCAHVHADAYCGELASDAIDAQAVAVFDPDAARARSFASTRNLIVTTNATELCKLVDAVIVTSEHARYPELVAAAAATGTPVLCEKPLGISKDAASSILQSGAWVSVAFPMRYAHAVLQAKGVIAGGALGALVAMSGVNHGAFPGGFFGTRAESGGGAIIDHVVHLVDVLRWLTDCEYASVYAEASNLRAVGDVEDAAQVVVTTRSGAWVSIDPSWSRPRGMAGANDFAMTVWFEHGTLSIDAFARHGELIGDAGHVTHLPYGVSADAAMLIDWVAAVRDGGDPPIPMEDGWKATEVALAAIKSAELGEVVTLAGAERTP